MILPNDTEQFALIINGRKTNVNLKDYYIFANTIGVNAKSAEKMIKKVISMKDKYIFMCRNSYIVNDMKNVLESLIKSRI